MSEAPKRIWAVSDGLGGDGVPLAGYWSEDRSEYQDGAPYFAGDDVAELVEAAKGMLAKIDTVCLVERDHPQAGLADAWRGLSQAVAKIEAAQ